MATRRQPIDFWFSIGSTYSYLTVSRLPELEARSGVPFRWRPFNVRSIMRDMNNVPFSTKPAKAAYMWRDVERRAATHGVPFAGIPPYPIAALERANRIALVAAGEGWVVPFTQAAYRKWFLEHRQPVDDDSIAADLSALGQDPARVLARADSEAGIAALERETGEAKALGVFGSPTFVVGRELFWGDDRLDDAMQWWQAH
jgi:2-hydroxychromene-2-carboxylate isomerase